MAPIALLLLCFSSGLVDGRRVKRAATVGSQPVQKLEKVQEFENAKKQFEEIDQAPNPDKDKEIDEAPNPEKVKGFEKVQEFENVQKGFEGMRRSSYLLEENGELQATLESNTTWSSRRRRSLELADKVELAVEVSGRVMEVIENVLSVDFCWRTTTRRGERKANCGSGSTPTPAGLRCYKNCPAGYQRNGAYCEKPCPQGSTRAPVLARCNVRADAYSRRCTRTGWAGVCTAREACKAGYGTGAYTCRRSATWTAVTRKRSPSHEKNACTDRGYPEGPYPTGLGVRCFQPPPDNFDCSKGAPAICWAKCPGNMIVCGLGLSCGTDTSTCAANIADMSLSVVMAAAETALLISSFGSSAAATPVIKQSTKGAFKQAAKQGLKSFQKKLRKLSTVSAIKTAVKKKVKKALPDFAVDTVHAAADVAVTAYINNFLLQTESGIDAQSFEAFDITGLTTAIRTSVENEPAVETAKAWVDVVGAIDPSGWISAVASFMNPKCEQW